MSDWNFKKEEGNLGANTLAQLKQGNQPYSSADVLTSKRNVILTEAGWVRREAYTDQDGNERVKDEILVAANPGDSTYGYANATHTGGPDVAQLYYSNSTGGSTITNGQEAQLYVVFNEPIKHGTPAGNLQITFTSVPGGETGNVAVCNTTAATINGNNTLVFNFTISAAGTVKVDTQTIASEATPTANIVSNVKLLSDGVTAMNQAANLTITAATSNGIVDAAYTAAALAVTNGHITVA